MINKYEFQGEWLTFDDLQKIVKIKTGELTELIKTAEDGERSLNHLLILRNHDKEVNRITQLRPKQTLCKKCNKRFKKESKHNCYCAGCKGKMNKIYVSPMEG